MADSGRERDGIRKVEGTRGVRWQAKVKVTGLKPRYKTFDKRTDAKRWQASEKAAMIERRHFAYAEADKHTFAEMIDRYIESESPVSAAYILRRWNDLLGHRLLSDIAPADIVEVRDRLKAEKTRKGNVKAPATVNRYLANLSSVYTTAIKEWQWVSSNPVLAVKKLREPQGRLRYLSESERKALFTACKASRSPNLFPLVVLAVSTGARAGEMLDLRWPDVDLDRGVGVLHNTKNGERRPISIRGLALEALRGQLKVRREDTDRVFPADDPLRRYEYKDYFKTALTEAEIEDFRFHDLRHTSASYMAMNGASISEIAAVLGHKSLSVTQRYTHLSDEHVSDVVEKMNDKFLGGE